MASLVGQQLGPYTVIEQMGSGGMATVYRAHHPRLDRDVAIKMLHEAFQEDQNFLARFEREAQIVARLDHPHIVPVYDFDEYNGRPYLVMKYIEGHTLKAVLDGNTLALDQILELMPPIADALDYAHGQGVLHRDIKPSNVIIDTNGVPYLTDFGLARMAELGESTLSQDVLLGTPHYISPEQAMGSRELDARTDLYSLGVVLYELVVGRVPFSADTPYAVIHDHIYRELPKPSEIDPEITPAIDAVLVKALAKNPADRYESATAMVDAFRRAVDQSHLQTLNPDRASLASESLAKLRDQQNQSVSIPAPQSAPKPASKPAPKHAPDQRQPRPPRQPQPFEDEYDADEGELPPNRLRVPGIPQPPGGFPHPPTRHEIHKAQREARRGARREGRRIVEASFDFSDAGRALAQAGDAVRGVIEDVSSSWDSPNDPDLIPMDDPEAIRRRIETQFKKRNEFYGHLIAFVLVNVVFWVIGLATVGFALPLIVTLAWGAGLAAHAADVFFQTGRRATARLRAIQSEFYNVFGDDWQHADRKELRRIRARVQEPFTKRREFASHLSVFVLINLMLWLLYAFRSDLPFDIGSVLSSIPFPIPLIVTLGWGIGLVFHAFEALTAGSRERAISRAVEREQDRLYGDYSGEKSKRDWRGGDRSQRSQPSLTQQSLDDLIDEPRVRLTQDGEFTDSMVEELDADEADANREDEKRKRSNR